MMTMAESMADARRERILLSSEDLSERNVSPLFRRTVDRGFERADGRIIENHNTADALYLFRKILLFAENNGLSVTLFSGTLREDFYNHLVCELDALIAKGLSVCSYVTETDLKDVVNPVAKNWFATKILSAQDEKGDANYWLKELKGGVKRTLDNGEVVLQEIPHVIYAGKGEAFRWETNSDTHEAIAAFGPMKRPLGNYLLKKIMRGMPEKVELRL